MKNFRRILSLVLIFALLVPNMIFANELNEDDRFVFTDERVELVKSKSKDLDKKLDLTEDYKPTDMVRIIVELEGKPVIVRATESGQRYEDMSNSKKMNIESELYSAQAAIKSSISRNNINMKYEASFATVLNGFSGKVQFQDIEKLESIRGVRKVYISNEYERPIIKPDMGSSHDMIGSKEVWNSEDLGYKGEGMVVAIIDTGIDPSHKDFVLTDDETAKIKEEDLVGKELLGRFYTEKVPYGYNYYDLNNEILDLGPDASEHGMHVAGTVTANGEIKGVAPESQVLAMKVFSNDPKYATTFDDIYLVAIEEAIELKADVINMSLGSTASFYIAESAVDTAITNATENGIVASISAGNSGYTGYGYDLLTGNLPNPLKEDPDYGLVGAPSLSKDSVSVASVENSEITVSYLEYDIGVDGEEVETLPRDTVIIHDEAYDLYAFNRDHTIQKKLFDALNAGRKVYIKFSDEVIVTHRDELADPDLLPETVTYIDKDGNRSERSVLPVESNGGEIETKKAPMNLAGPYVLADEIEGEIEFVHVNMGKLEDFAGKDLNNKVALIIRGELPFTEKIENAEAAGAAGVIIYNHVDGGEELINMQYPDKGTIPAGFIGNKYGAELVGLANKVVRFPKDKITAPNSNEGKMSEFSSYGTTPTLEMKPEITAPGGMIYSTLQNDSYGTMSGTSMAAPHLSGGAALVLQYIKDQGLASDLKAETQLAKILLMNTSSPVIQKELGLPVLPFEEAPYSPRLQGAGLMKLNRAVTTPVYVVDNSNLGSKGEAKVELKDFDQKNFTLKLKAVNFSDEEVEYSVDVNAYKDVIHPAEVNLLGSEEVKISVTGDNNIIVGANSEVEFELTIDFSGDSSVYRNMFIEGWVTLKDLSDTHSDLNVPYVGFYGDWDEPRIVDAMIGEENSYYGFSGMADAAGYFYEMNHEGIMAFSPGTEDGEWWEVDTITAVPSFLRNAEKVEFNILDKDDNKLRTISKESYVRKNYIDGGRYNPYSYLSSREWDGKVKGKIVEDGLYKYEIKAKVQNGEWQSKLIPVYVDTVGPEVREIVYDNETGDLSWIAEDELSGISLIFVDINGKGVETIEVEDDQTEFTINIKEIMDEVLEKEGDHKIVITALDNALNEGSGVLTISNDTTSPYIYLLSPDLLAVYDKNTIDVEGYVLKENEITSVRVDGIEADVRYSEEIRHTNPDGEIEIVSGYVFTAKLEDLEDGVHAVEVEAESLAGTTASIARRFYVDTTPPEFVNVEVLERESDSATVDLEITMKDNFPVLDLYVYDSHEFSFDDSETAFDMNPVEETTTVTVRLEDGINQIPLRLVDIAGNEALKTVEVEKREMPTVEGRIQTEIFGDTLIVANMEESKVSEVMLNDRKLSKGAPTYEYGFDGTDLRIAINEEIVKVIITIEGVKHLVVIV